MKKIFLSLFLVFVVFLSACQQKQDQKNEEQTSSVSSPEAYISELERLQALSQDLLQVVTDNKAEADIQKSFTELKEAHQKLTPTAQELKKEVGGAEHLVKLEPLLFPEYKIEQKDNIVATINALSEAITASQKTAK